MSQIEQKKAGCANESYDKSKIAAVTDRRYSCFSGH